MSDLPEALRDFKPDRLGTPRRYKTRGDLDPLFLDGLQRLGYDPDEYLRQYNETVRRTLENEPASDRAGEVER